MTLPSSGNSISMYQINQEIGYSVNSQRSLNDTGVRSLLNGIATQQISMGEGFGKTFLLPVKYYMVAGGGGGGSNSGGGGGGGQVRSGTLNVAPGTSFTFTIGAGGGGSSGGTGTRGSNTVFNGLTSSGGYGGVSYSGTGGNYGAGTYTGGAGNYGGGGGAGASANGGDAPGDGTGGNGSNGIEITEYNPGFTYWVGSGGGGAAGDYWYVGGNGGQWAAGGEGTNVANDNWNGAYEYLGELGGGGGGSGTSTSGATGSPGCLWIIYPNWWNYLSSTGTATYKYSPLGAPISAPINSNGYYIYFFTTSGTITF